MGTFQKVQLSFVALSPSLLPLSSLFSLCLIYAQFLWRQAVSLLLFFYNFALCFLFFEWDPPSVLLIVYYHDDNSSITIIFHNIYYYYTSQWAAFCFIFLRSMQIYEPYFVLLPFLSFFCFVFFFASFKLMARVLFGTFFVLFRFFLWFWKRSIAYCFFFCRLIEQLFLLLDRHVSTHTAVFRRYIANIDAFNLHLVYDLDIIEEIEKGESRVSERERERERSH